MSGNKTLTKEQILKAIEQLAKNPNDKLGILADIGIGVVGAGAAGAAVAAFGGTSILFGLVALAPPVGLVVGGAALGAAALVGAKRIFFDGTFNQGKQAEMLQQLQEQLREVETKERVSKVGESDKTKFIVSLKEPVRLNLISPKDAQNLMRAVESGQMPIKEAIKMVQAIVEAAKPQ
ncbi:MAG: hypothetical protein JGK12_04530 [Microcoleus sp. PH2017_01_SCD_O_A]|uniref:hypothetical protein n=1 Tax=unclassified Microcoleus TaxID=2642155 RepID=UPI001D4CCD61|nr:MULTISPECIES: hypothetical protein [unclassified Microcoleus]MCC3423199.1 hypothetical protein [Microcoleus sp. PH2017_01_SCD_O_A]MCC3453097.1 hypothetical protein [Microcoleus sp. PH2017_08_TRC_O_A]TAG65346.1 MAG: hypothetical protein EAZ25_16300 [Oscillatoriales cyanobacterium]